MNFDAYCYLQVLRIAGFFFPKGNNIQRQEGERHMGKEEGGGGGGGWWVEDNNRKTGKRC